MKIEFKHGPKDGLRRFLPVGKATDTIIVEVNGVDYLYRRTTRLTTEGYILYQCLGVVSELTAA